MRVDAKAAPPARADFLLEIGVEELPATYALPALEALERGLAADLGELRLRYRRMESYAADLTWSDLWLQNEKEFCRYNAEEADVAALRSQFAQWEGEAERLLKLGLVFPGYDAVVKCSHLFNLLEARGAISVSERVGVIARVRRLARLAARAYAASREAQGYPWRRAAGGGADGPAPAADAPGGAAPAAEGGAR